MGKINILPAKVYNRIAAGEVVEKPYSVVKELVENAIDAGATEIEIEIEKGGKSFIRVTDNGHGIEREDMHAAFLPHATSKISKAEDLEGVLTLGFRGEAIASIASVSKMTIVSKTENGKCYRLSSNAGEIGELTETSGENGTQVTVENLFCNTPVRLDFLKTDKSEEADITTFVSRFILNRSDIAFTYYVNDKKVLQSFGEGEESALLCVYGASTLQNCYQIDAEKHGIRIRGYIGNQNFSKPNKSYQNVFLNGRYIVNATISAAISNVYKSYLMKRQYPFCVLHITVPTGIVDVNVHPNKADVRFADNNIVYGCIYSVLSAVLDGNSKALDYIVPTQSPMQDDVKSSEKTEKKSISQNILEMAAMTAEKEETSGSDSIFGFSSFTLEEARKEIENCKPKIVAPPVQREKGVTPLSEIGEYNPVEVADFSPRLPFLDKQKKRKKDPEKLHRKYPDLYFERKVLELRDSSCPQTTSENVEEDYFLANKKYLEELDEKNKQNRIDVSACTYAGKLFNTYLLYERDQDVYIIDQHAAHERLIFNRLKEKMQNRTVSRQPMLLPYELKLNAFEADFIRERMQEIREIGFEIEEDGETNFKILSIPYDLKDIDLSKFFNEILGDVSGYRAIKLEDILKDKLASAACKAAIKGGMDLTKEEIEELFRLMDGDMGLKCPHGRPVVVKMARTQLEKMFKRIV